jgi:Icc protein
VLIVQLSDMHVRQAGKLFLGKVDSNAMLVAAVARVNALDPAPDVVLLTGDLVEKSTDADYVHLLALLAPLAAPVLPIPGNHDERDGLRRAFPGHRHMPPAGPINYVAGDLGPVRIVAFDITVPGRHHGEVTEEGARWLDAALAAEPGRPTLVMMHQPPFASGVPYLDASMCRGGERLAEVVSRHGSVERIVCGHVHRFMQVRFGGTILCTAPSTATSFALQIRPDAKALWDVESGFLVHHWREGTGLVTHLVPTAATPGPFPFAGA